MKIPNYSKICSKNVDIILNFIYSFMKRVLFLHNTQEEKANFGQFYKKETHEKKPIY